MSNTTPTVQLQTNSWTKQAQKLCHWPPKALESRLLAFSLQSILPIWKSSVHLSGLSVPHHVNTWAARGEITGCRWINPTVGLCHGLFPQSSPPPCPDSQPQRCHPWDSLLSNFHLLSQQRFIHLSLIQAAASSEGGRGMPAPLSAAAHESLRFRAEWNCAHHRWQLDELAFLGL